MLCHHRIALQIAHSRKCLILKMIDKAPFALALNFGCFIKGEKVTTKLAQHGKNSDIHSSFEGARRFCNPSRKNTIVWFNNSAINALCLVVSYSTLPNNMN